MVAGFVGVPALKVVAFQPAQWALYRDLRLMALKDSPEAFGGTYAQAARVSDAVWASRLANADGVRDLPLLLLVDDVAAGMAWGTMDRTSTETACVYQMWVAPEYRGLGGGSLLLDQIICLLYTSPSPRDGLLSRMPSSA